MAQTVDVGVEARVQSGSPSVLEADETAGLQRTAVSSRHPGLPPTRWRYAQGCRCDGCVEANRSYAADGRRRRARPDRLALAALLPPGRVRSHLRDLLASGLSAREVAARAGVSHATIGLILDGQGRVTARVAAAVIDVLPDHEPVDASEPLPGIDPVHMLRLPVDPADQAWKKHGECGRLTLTRDEWNRAFFPTQGHTTEIGKQVCNGGRPLGTGLVSEPCPVRAECLAFALEHAMHGIWGGTNQEERDAIRKAT